VRNLSFKKPKVLRMIKNWFKPMTVKDPDLDNPEELRTYLKENMAEGYLSESEGLNIDEFVDRYEELLDLKQDFQSIVKELQGVKVE